MEDKGALLKTGCDAILADPALKPTLDKNGESIETHCNQGTRIVAQLMGCTEFDDMGANANVMYAIMSINASGRWKKVKGSEACVHALSGGLAIAARSSSQIKANHGHITVVYPVGMERSDSLGKDVPKVANIGRGDQSKPLEPIKGQPGKFTRPNFICKVSAAFPVKTGEPDYFIWA